MQLAKLFSTKYREYSRRDDESYDEFVEQYHNASRDLSLSSSERLQYLHNLFLGRSPTVLQRKCIWKATWIFWRASNDEGTIKLCQQAAVIQSGAVKSIPQSVCGRSWWRQRKSVQGTEESNWKMPHTLPCYLKARESQDRVSSWRVGHGRLGWKYISRVGASTSKRGLCSELGNALTLMM